MTRFCRVAKASFSTATEPSPQAHLIASMTGIIFILTSVCVCPVAEAYIGPGAGFAVMSSFLVLLVTAVLAVFTLLLWPFRALWRMLRRRKRQRRRQAKRVVVLGLDGLDPELTQQFMEQGKMPNFQALQQEGSFRPLRTSCPPISPVAWSTFATGVNPAKHRIFDFFTRDPRTYRPVLSSVEIKTSLQTFGLGSLKIPWRKTRVKLLRKSISFWKILSDMGEYCSVLRVPITFPPEKLYGTCLAGMCVPDIRGTQGAFTVLTSRPQPETASDSEGLIVSFAMQGNRFTTQIPGPPVERKGTTQTLSLPVKGVVDADKKTVTLHIAHQKIILRQGRYSPWITLDFRASRFQPRISGIARFLVTEITPHLTIYVTPININPENPALPVSSPTYYAPYLAKCFGPFATLGLAEDTWALNEGVINEDAFLQQTYDIYEDRKTHFFDALKKTPEGLIVCVIDTTDRIQHTFFRYLDPEHPANTGRHADAIRHAGAIEELYQRMDNLLGEVRQKLGNDDVLFVMSDHGFKNFRWGVNLNSWLWREGYLVMKDGVQPGEPWFAGVDWSQTRAFGYALAGIFLNVQGRERQGIVAPGQERLALQQELQQKLEALYDANSGQKPIRRCMKAQEVLHGPYLNDAPDLLVGYQAGYRVSWNSAVGKITEHVIEPNTKPWSGDHCIDPELVPGVLLCNRAFEDASPGLEDLAPTILSLFGGKRQKFHDGEVLTFSLNYPEVQRINHRLHRLHRFFYHKRKNFFVF